MSEEETPPPRSQAVSSRQRRSEFDAPVKHPQAPRAPPVRSRRRESQVSEEDGAVVGENRSHLPWNDEEDALVLAGRTPVGRTDRAAEVRRSRLKAEEAEEEEEEEEKKERPTPRRKDRPPPPPPPAPPAPPAPSPPAYGPVDFSDTMNMDAWMDNDWMW